MDEVVQSVPSGERVVIDIDLKKNIKVKVTGETSHLFKLRC